jgi:hypothetical protein
MNWLNQPGTGQVIAGTAGVPRANEREARTACLRAFAGGTPAVPANHLRLVRSVNAIDSPAKNHGYPFTQREERRELWLLFQQREVFIAAKLDYCLR